MEEFAIRIWLGDNSIEVLSIGPDEGSLVVSLAAWEEFVKEIEAANRKISLIRKVIREDAEELLKQTLPKGE